MGDIPNLSREQWESMHKALSVHAYYKILRLSWKGLPRGKSLLMPGGQSPEDVAAEAIVRVLDGTRKCQGSNYKELLSHFKGVVDSIVSDAVRGPENSKARMLHGTASIDELHPPSKEAAKPQAGPAVAEEIDQVDWLRKSIRAKIEPDTLAVGVFRCLEQEIDSPTDMSTLLEVPVTEIHKAQKRLRTAVLSILRQQKGAKHGRA